MASGPSRYPDGGTDQLTDLERLQLKANQITDESLESTRRMVQLCEESEAAGAKTMTMLDEQGEQLNKIEKGMDDMNAEMKQAEKHITGMEKWCGLCVCPWNRSRKIRDTDGAWKGGNESSKEKQKSTLQNQPQASESGTSSGPYIKRLNEGDDREVEMEENMQVVGRIVNDLKYMAEDMGNEIESQNKQIDRLNAKSQSVDVRINAANKRTENLLKK